MSDDKIARSALFAIAGLAIASMVSTAASAENLIYNPLNPGFGGNPNTYDYLQGLAEIQNQHLPAQSGGGGAAPEFSFPPIVIDLGGLGLPDTPPVDPVPAQTQ